MSAPLTKSKEREVINLLTRRTAIQRQVRPLLDQIEEITARLNSILHPMKYKVTYEYRGTVTLDVEAPSAEEAENAGQREADEAIVGALSVYDVTARPAPASRDAGTLVVPPHRIDSLGESSNPTHPRSNAGHDRSNDDAGGADFTATTANRDDGGTEAPVDQVGPRADAAQPSAARDSVGAGSADREGWMQKHQIFVSPQPVPTQDGRFYAARHSDRPWCIRGPVCTGATAEEALAALATELELVMPPA